MTDSDIKSAGLEKLNNILQKKEKINVNNLLTFIFSSFMKELIDFENDGWLIIVHHYYY